ncbi:unnamed protein product, partial [Sphacelaria rigidula]
AQSGPIRTPICDALFGLRDLANGPPASPHGCGRLRCHFSRPAPSKSFLPVLCIAPSFRRSGTGTEGTGRSGGGRDNDGSGWAGRGLGGSPEALTSVAFGGEREMRRCEGFKRVFRGADRFGCHTRAGEKEGRSLPSYPTSPTVRWRYSSWRSIVACIHGCGSIGQQYERATAVDGIR